MATYQSFDDKRIKHMELIQAVVARLGNDGFIVKGWAITVAGVLFGFAVSSSDWRLALVSVLTTGAFWGVDTYFLRSERLFRELYEAVRTARENIEPFYMSATSKTFIESLPPTSRNVASWWKTVRRPTLAILYMVLLVAAVLLMLTILNTTNPQMAPGPHKSP